MTYYKENDNNNKRLLTSKNRSIFSQKWNNRNSRSRKGREDIESSGNVFPTGTHVQVCVVVGGGGVQVYGSVKVEGDTIRK